MFDASRQSITDHATISARQRALLLAVRQALLIVLREIEDYLDMPRSVPTRRRER